MKKGNCNLDDYDVVYMIDLMPRDDAHLNVMMTWNTFAVPS